MSIVGLRIEYLGRQRWRLLATRVVLVDGLAYAIPAGTVTNFTSIPRLAWWLMGHPLGDATAEEALWHDTQCDAKALPSPRVHRLFYRALRAHVRRDYANPPGGWRRRLAWEWNRVWRHVHALLCYWAVAVFGPRWTTLPSLR